MGLPVLVCIYPQFSLTEPNGIKVTINTDDMIIFDQSVSQEFFSLCNAGLFNANELNEISENGLSVVLNT